VSFLFVIEILRKYMNIFSYVEIFFGFFNKFVLNIKEYDIPDFVLIFTECPDQGDMFV